jgi:hypothetical protein
MKKFLTPNVVVGLLFLLGLGFRLYGLSWDQGTHLHPDERFLTMVANDIHLPNSIAQYFDNSTSPVNPYNYSQFQFYVYGIFPVLLTKVIAVLLHLDSYQYLNLVGRALSAVFDSINIILLYLITKKTFSSKSKLHYLPSFLYATTVLPIQLSHFFAVDTFLTTFLLATFTLVIYSRFFLAGITFGLALACKISASTFAPIILIFLIRDLVQTKNLKKLLINGLGFGFLSSLLFRVADPYIFKGLFLPNPLFLDNLKTLQSFSDPEGWFPPAVQWMSKIPLIFSLQNIILWGLGLPLSILFLISIFKTKKHTTSFIYFTILFWVISLYLFQGSQFAHNMRYFLPIYPFILLLITYKTYSLKAPVVRGLVILHLLFGLAFLGIYSRPHTRVQASEWIYDHIKKGALLTFEEWDDPLPLGYYNRVPQIYSTKGLSLYDPDQPKKWTKLNPILDSANYMVLSSNRLWGSIPLVPTRYPETTKFYQDLFNNRLSYSKIYESSSYPGFSIPFLKKCIYLGPSNIPGINNRWFEVDSNCAYPGVYLRDDTAEESFSVYDHPRVIIFRRNSSVL